MRTPRNQFRRFSLSTVDITRRLSILLPQKITLVHVLVTGGTGFTGSPVVDHLHRRAEVRVLNNLRSGFEPSGGLQAGLQAAIAFLRKRKAGNDRCSAHDR